MSNGESNRLRWQLTRFLALMQNWNIATSSTESALNSQGSAMRENEKYMQSLEARIQKMKTAGDTLALSLGNAFINDSIITLTYAVTGLANNVAFLIDRFGGLPLILGTIGIAVYAASSAFRAFILNIAKTIANLYGIVPAATAAKTSITSLATASTVTGKALGGLKTALRGLLATTGVGLVFVGIGAALEGLLSKFGKSQESIDDLSDSYQQLSNAIADKERVSKLSEEYNKLANITNKTAEQKIRLSEVESELRNSFAVSIEPLNEQNDALKENNELIQRRIDLLDEEIKRQRESAQTKFLAQESEINEKIADNAEKEAKARKELEEAELKLLEFEKRRGLGNRIDNRDRFFNPNDIRLAGSIQKFGEKLADDLDKARKAWNEASTNLDNAVKDKKDALIANFQGYADAVEASGEKVEPATRILIDAFATASARLDDRGFHIQSKNFEEIFKIFNTSNISNVEEASNVLEKALNKSGISLDDLGDALKYVDMELKKLDYQPSIDDAENYADAMEEVKDSVSDTIKELSSLASAYDTLNKGEKLSAETLIELITKYPLLAQHLANTNDLTFNRGELIKQVAEIERQARLAEAQAALDSAMNTKNELETKQNLYRQFFENMINAGGSIDAWMFGSALNKEEQARLDEASKKVDELLAKIKVLNQPLSFFGGSKSSSSSASSKSKEFEIYEADIYAQTLKDIDVALAVLNSTKEKTNKDSEEYIGLLQQEISLLKQRQDAAHEEANRLRDINSKLTSQRAKLSSTSEEYQKLSKEIDDNEDKIKNLQIAWRGWEKDIIGINSSINDVTQSIKDQKKEIDKGVYETIRDKELKAIDDIAKAEDKRHQERMDHLDDEMNKFQEAIDMVRKSINRQDAADDFNKELKRLQKEELDIRKQIDVMSLDNSIEGQYKREQLEQELADKLEEIEKLKLDRTRKLRNDNLDDLQDAKKKEIDAEKKKEDQIYKFNKENLDRIKDEITQFWNDTINNENTYLQTQEDIINRHLENVKSSINIFAQSLSSITRGIGHSLSSAITGVISDYPTNNLGQNKTEQADIEKMKANSRAWAESTSLEERKRLADENLKIGRKHGWYRDEATGIWYDKKGVRLYHQGGEVGIPGSTTKRWWDKVLKSNEVPAILRKGEVVLDRPNNFISDLVSRTINGLSSLSPRVANAGRGVSNYYYDINIDKLEGGEAGAKALFKYIKIQSQRGNR